MPIHPKTSKMTKEQERKVEPSSEWQSNGTVCQWPWVRFQAAPPFFPACMYGTFYTVQILSNACMYHTCIVLCAFIYSMCIEFPSYWEGHREDEEWKVVPISPHGREFKEIAALFSRTMPSSMHAIVRIERVQNKLLWNLPHILT